MKNNNNFNINNFETKSFKIEIEENYDKENSIILNITGILFHEIMEDVKTYIHELHKTIVDNNIKEVVTDLFNLELIDQHAFGELMDYFVKVNTMDENEKYNFVIIYDKSKQWQKNLFIMSKNIFSEIISIEGI